MFRVISTSLNQFCGMISAQGYLEFPSALLAPILMFLSPCVEDASAIQDKDPEKLKFM